MNQVQLKTKAIFKGLTIGKHGFHIHEYGNQIDGCKSMGGHFNPFGQVHGGRNSEQRHVGDLGNIEVTNNEETVIHIIDKQVSLFGKNSVIGRGMVVHEKEDDLGMGCNKESLITGNAGARICCGIIAHTL